MKQIITAIAIFLAFCLFSCGKTSCLTPSVGFVFTNNADTIPDTIAYVIEYQKDGTFLHPVDSFGNLALAIHTSATEGKYLDIPDSHGGSVFYNYDWKIVLQPSGKSYLVTNANHSNEKSSSTGLGGVKSRCVNSVSYNVNGVNYDSGVWQTMSSSASVIVKIHYNN